MKKTYASVNGLVTIVMIVANYIAGVKGFNGNTVGGLSAEYDNLFTPAGYAFAIWSLIFIALLFHAYYQIKKAFFNSQDSKFLIKMGPWLILANICNVLWLYLWLMEFTVLSVLAMLVILFSLMKLIVNLNLEREDAPFKVIRWIWWPIVIYAGWITVATIANISALLAKNNWSALFSEETWTILMIVVAAGLNLFMLISRNMREFVAVGVWALTAIAVRHWGEIQSIQWTALLAAVFLTMAIMIHAAINWDTNPLNKVLRKK